MNEGCIPTKALLRSAEVVHLVREKAAKYGVRGIDPDEILFDLVVAMERKDKVVRGIIDGIYKNLNRNKSISLYNGKAEYSSPVDIKVNGNYLFVAGGNSGLMIYDITVPATPTLVANYNTQASALSLDVIGYYVFVAASGAGLLVIDVSNINEPILVGQNDTPGRAVALDVQGNYAYVADDFSGLQIIDISDPTVPYHVGTYSTSAWTSMVTVYDSLAYINEGDHLVILNVMNPNAPVSIANLYIGIWLNGISLSNSRDYLLLSNGWDGVEIINVSNPFAPYIDGFYDTPGFVSSVISSDSFAY
ncbi:MAG: hypothetical protein IH859_04885, partial [Chloroflexi bacterium]|nr:hypothetical protein [Chloroflexota bacterium]